MQRALSKSMVTREANGEAIITCWSHPDACESEYATRRSSSLALSVGRKNAQPTLSVKCCTFSPPGEGSRRDGHLHARQLICGNQRTCTYSPPAPQPILASWMDWIWPAIRGDQRQVTRCEHTHSDVIRGNQRPSVGWHLTSRPDRNQRPSVVWHLTSRPDRREAISGRLHVRIAVQMLKRILEKEKVEVND